MARRPSEGPRSPDDVSDEIHILHVDDDAEFLEVAAEQLRRVNDAFVVHTAGSGAAGIDTLDAEPIDCVVSGFELPDMDGLALLEAVRETAPDLPFLLFTGAGSEAVAADAISAGVTDYVRKRPDGDQFASLASSVERAVRQRTDREAAHERELETYASILESLDDAVYALDGEGRIVLVNESYVRMKDVPRSALLGTHISEWVDDDTLDRSGALLEELQRGDRTVGTLEYEFQAGTGERVPVELRFVTVTLPDGSEGRAGVIRDISERVDRERQLQRKTERLERFASVVSHDLRNPLSVAVGRLELARDTGDLSHLEPALDALDRMETLVDDLLTLASEGESNDATAVDVGALARDCWEAVETGDATLEVDLDGTVRTNTTRLRQLFENLFVNAVEHAGSGVTVTVGSLPDGFYVADDGPGIDPADEEAVFEAGYSSARHGSGFGLSIVSEVAAEHGWELQLGDASGARFEFRGVEWQ